MEGADSPLSKPAAHLTPTAIIGGRAKRGQAKQEIVNYLLKNPDGVSSSKLSQDLSLPISSIYSNLSTLKEEGRIETINGVNKLK